VGSFHIIELPLKNQPQKRCKFLDLKLTAKLHKAAVKMVKSVANYVMTRSCCWLQINEIIFTTKSHVCELLLTCMQNTTMLYFLRLHAKMCEKSSCDQKVCIKVNIHNPPRGLSTVKMIFHQKLICLIK
jgi:hypothetical protein